MSAGRYLQRLGARIEGTGSVLCVGLDPDPEALPAGFPASAQGVERFTALVVEACAPVAAAFKPNLAFFEALGSPGLAALERVRALIPSDVLVIADAKRGDIGTSALRQAVACGDVLRADAVTVSPYLGRDAVTPFIDHGLFAYVLSRTSNPSAGEVQDLVVGSPGAARAARRRSAPKRAEQADTGDPGDAGMPLYERVARLVAEWDRGEGRHGLVVGATAPTEMAAIRAAAPDLAFLVPGVGAQGGDLDAALAEGRARGGPAGRVAGGALLVNVSRAIAQAAGKEGQDPGEALADAARAWAARTRVLHSRPIPA